MAVGQAVGDEEDRDKVLVKGRVCEETVVTSLAIRLIRANGERSEAASVGRESRTAPTLACRIRQESSRRSALPLTCTHLQCAEVNERKCTLLPLPLRRG